jgi:hypothetical protein
VAANEVSLRERVRRAIAEHVDASEELLLQLDTADEATKLITFASGWFRGLAAALEEMAVEIDQMRRPEAGAPEPRPMREPPRLDDRLEEAEALQERAERELPSDAGAGEGLGGPSSRHGGRDA